LKISDDELRRLPLLAKYTAQSGRANLEVERSGDTTIIYARCDSLERLLEFYEGFYRLHQDQHETEEAVITKTVPDPKTAFKWFLYGLLAGITGTIIFIVFIKQ